ncbi:MAG: class II aldolase/adducin family protein [Calditrichaeota bacterium]|nr:MAG: class II aldolase/adducin family protein [Calditrichota bacterium]
MAERREQLVAEMIAIGRRLYARGLIVATEGNFAVRLSEDRLLATASGVCKGELQPEDLVEVDLAGQPRGGHRRVSTEIALHLEVFRQRPDVQASLHAHPPHCIALTLLGRSLDRAVLAENVVLLGKVPLARYATPGTPAIADSIRPFIRQTDCILLERHGSLSVGQSLTEAFYKLETMEHTAMSYLHALQIGEVRELAREEIVLLQKMRRAVYGLTTPFIPFVEE